MWIIRVKRKREIVKLEIYEITIIYYTDELSRECSCNLERGWEITEKDKHPPGVEYPTWLE